MPMRTAKAERLAPDGRSFCCTNLYNLQATLRSTIDGKKSPFYNEIVKKCQMLL